MITHEAIVRGGQLGLEPRANGLQQLGVVRLFSHRQVRWICVTFVLLLVYESQSYSLDI